jgi:hypothetical protein
MLFTPRVDLRIGHHFEGAARVARFRSPPRKQDREIGQRFAGASGVRRLRCTIPFQEPVYKKMPAPATCELCSKEFKSRQAKYLHRMYHCPVKKAREASETKMQINALQKELVTVKQQLNDAVTAINGNTTNYTTNNIAVRINNFRAVDTSYIAHEVVAEMIKSGDLRAALQEMVEMLHYNPAHPENMNDKFYDVIGYDVHPLGETIGTMARNKDLMEKTHPVLGCENLGGGCRELPGSSDR